MKTRHALLFSLALGLATTGPAFAACDVTLSSILPSNQAVLKADCGNNVNMTEITWIRNGDALPGFPVTFPATPADLNFTTLLTSGTHSYTARGFAGGDGTVGSGTAVASGKAAIVTLSQPILTVAVSPGGMVTSAPPGITDCTSAGGTCAAGYDTGTTVVLTPTPASSGFVFTGWGGDCSGTGNCTLSMTTVRTATATFSSVPTYPLTVTSSGGTVAGNGISCPGTCSVNLTSGTQVSLTATPTPPNTVVSWSGSCAGNVGNTCAFTMAAAAMSAGASFSTVPTYSLNVTSTAGGSVGGTPGISSCTSTSGTCSASALASGTAFNLTATPAGGYVFNGWTGGCTGTAACTGTVTANTNITATFGTNPTYTLTVSPSSGGSVSGSGIVNCTSTSGTCSVGSLASGTGLTLSATAASGYTFSGWSGGGCSGTSSCSVTLTANTTVNATFTVASTAGCSAPSGWSCNISPRTLLSGTPAGYPKGVVLDMAVFNPYVFSTPAYTVDAHPIIFSSSVYTGSGATISTNQFSWNTNRRDLFISNAPGSTTPLDASNFGCRAPSNAENSNLYVTFTGPSFGSCSLQKDTPYWFNVKPSVAGEIMNYFVVFNPNL